MCRSVVVVVVCVCVTVYVCVCGVCGHGFTNATLWIARQNNTWLYCQIFGVHTDVMDVIGT